MSTILKDFWKKKLNFTVCTIIQILLFPALIFLNIEDMYGKPVGMILIVLLAGMEFFGIWSLAEQFIITPLRLKKQFNSLPESEISDIISQYPAAKRVGNHVYLENWMVIHQGERLFVVAYSDIISVRKRLSALKITAKVRKKPILMGFPEDGANAVTAAYIKNKNPEVKILGSAD